MTNEPILPTSLRKQLEHEARTYRVTMHCTNCGHEGDICVPKGQRKPSLQKCQACECNTYKPVWRAK
jgi:transcription elongation factor Elf1